MLRLLLKNASVLLLAVVIGAWPALARAQTTAPADKKSPAQNHPPASAEKKPVAGPFHGKLAALDKTAKTIKVGKRTFQVTPETKIKRADKPSTLDDAIVGEEISGYVKPGEDGRLFATTINLGPKSPKKGSGQKKQP